MMDNNLTNSFNSGELSGLLAGRGDVSRFNSGCKTAQNGYVLVAGGITNRPGTYYVAPTKDSAKKFRLESFQFSVEQAYILEFGHEYIRFYKDNGQILDGETPYEIESPYSESDLFDLQFEQSADILYIWHNNYPRMKLSRSGHTAWTLSEREPHDGPFLASNINETITLAVSATSGTGKTLTAVGGNVFVSEHVGAIFKITHQRADSAVSGDLTANGSSASLKVDGDWTFRTGGTWTGKVTIERSKDNGTSWQVIRTVRSNNDTNATSSGEEDENVLYRVTMSSFTSGKCTYTLECMVYETDGVVKITAVNSPTIAVCDVISPIESTTATYNWSEGAYSDYRGYPGCGAFHEGRLWEFGTKYQPDGYFGSVIDKFDNYKTGPLDTDAIVGSLSSEEVNQIRWAKSQNVLLLGTRGSEWQYGSRDEAITSSTAIPPRRQSKRGSKTGLAALVNDVVLFVQRGGRVVRECAYAFETDKFETPDMTIFAPHITGYGITALALATEPETMLYCVRADGKMACFTYERNHEVMGWTPIVTDGEIETVAVITGENEDQVWLGVKRIIDGETQRYIEYFKPRNFGDDIADAFYVDCGLSFDGGAAVTITDISESAGKTVVTAAGHGFADGNKIRLKDIVGPTQLNNKTWTVADAAEDSFALKDDDEVGYISIAAMAAYQSGGTAQRVAKIIDNLGHLENKSVSILADGSPVAAKVVTDGQIDIQRWANKIHVGLGYETIIEPMPFQTMSGARVKNISSVRLRFHRTVGCKVGPRRNNLEEVTFRKSGDLTDQAVAMYTGLKDVTISADWVDEAIVCVMQDQPLPMTLLAIYSDIN